MAASRKIQLLLLFVVSVAVSGKRHGSKHGDHHNPVYAHLFPRSAGYSEYVMPPTSAGEALIVEVNTFVREIGPLNLVDNSYRIQLTFRQKFNDSRLAHPGVGPVNLLGDEVKHIWSPDTFIRNERLSQQHGTLHPNVYARVNSEGEVMMSEKMTVFASCANLAKNLREEGSATCNFDIASYGLPDHLIQYTWKAGDNLQINDESSSFLGEEYSLKDFSTDKCQAVTATGTYTCLRIRFTFEKKA